MDGCRWLLGRGMSTKEEGTRTTGGREPDWSVSSFIVDRAGHGDILFHASCILSESNTSWEGFMQHKSLDMQRGVGRRG